MAWTLCHKRNAALRTLIRRLAAKSSDEILGSGGWVGVLENEDGGETPVSCTYTISLADVDGGLTPAVEFHGVWIDNKRGNEQLLFESGLIDRVLDRVFAIEVAVFGHPEAEAALRMQALKWSLAKNESVKEILGSGKD